MPQQHRSAQTPDAQLARRKARRLQTAFPAILNAVPVPVHDLARLLGLKIERRPDLRQRARLELLNEGETVSGTIAIRSGLEDNSARFAIAHEIGHAVLLWEHPQAAREWALDRRELFANVFAAEILASPELRARLAATFRGLSEPMDLLRFASRLGFSLHALLTLATQERSWIEDLKKIWLRVKYVENAFTHREPRLRIVSAHYDSNLFYVPTNQSLLSFAGDDQWLSSLPPGAVARHNAAVTLKARRPAPAEPKFVSKNVPAELSAVRLQPSNHDPAAYLIVLAQLSLTPHAETDSQ